MENFLGMDAHELTVYVIIWGIGALSALGVLALNRRERKRKRKR